MQCHMDDDIVDKLIDYCENENNSGFQQNVTFAIDNGFTEDEFKKTLEAFSITLNTIENHDGFWKYLGYLKKNKWNDDDVYNIKTMIQDGLKDIVEMLFNGHPQLNIVLNKIDK